MAKTHFCTSECRPRSCSGVCRRLSGENFFPPKTTKTIDTQCCLQLPASTCVLSCFQEQRKKTLLLFPLLSLLLEFFTLVTTRRYCYLVIIWSMEKEIGSAKKCGARGVSSRHTKSLRLYRFYPGGCLKSQISGRWHSGEETSGTDS